ncbi:uncharacterized protein L3040_006550 [Drepanopeziza brunnea f. sp. 'multigermtubi']|uniref:YSIRK family gram-positive signal peptide n=1 Tax=Marssonina brunnea f. sp. multigermtubi (strain MB_m1) TaxID=1072389 RepID=K1X1F5_MARBU|nr:YSIRK family gram-positive signal peptide [Drepanopeziza brunnea f. sp. 'multigermtubi' MB_m1]EKD19061.1 YSIRK family gram-positive signal peptide [Drepanopeziza brunnea f. sp. 'multigermtubi' MB_m1]KAJ5038871.1 hypothetical protein L3040_006550 [Drepanopeziza brunnea f. sp. 'multigermtubi']
MAPNASDPKDLKLVLNLARRRALSTLIDKIISHMRSKIEASFNGPQAESAAPLFLGGNSRSSSSDNTSTSPQPSPSPDPGAEARQKRLAACLEKPLSTPKLRELQRDALSYLDNWAREVGAVLGKASGGPEDARSEQRRRDYWLAARNPAPTPHSSVVSPPPGVKDVAAEVEADARRRKEAQDVLRLQSRYHPVPTRLGTISKEERVCVVSCVVLLLLSLGHYSAHSRVLLCYLTSALALPLSVLMKEETEVAQTLLLASKALTADAETQKRRAENASSRRWKVGLASIAGAAVIGITGGLAAPAVAGAIGGIMGGVGLGGVASFFGIFAMNGALVGSLFGAFGGKMTGEMVDAYAKEVSDFRFLPLASEWGEHGTKEEAQTEGRRLRVTIGINGWLNNRDDVLKPWRVLGRESEVFALQYEMEALIALGTSLDDMVSSYAWSYIKMDILKRTVLATLWSALWPVYLLKMATSIDNPFAVARSRSEKAGEVLADALINKAQGERPVTLVGYSLGSRVIYSCLRSLADRKAFGLIEDVVFIGSPVPSSSNSWRVMRSVVSGKLINVYSENDYILAFLYRATSIQFGIAGLQDIGDVEGVDNLNLSKEVSGHLRYPELIGKILKKSGFEGILVEDTVIEGDVAEIQLLDVEMGVLNVQDGDQKGEGGYETDLLCLMDSEPPTAELEAGTSYADRDRRDPAQGFDPRSSRALDTERVGGSSIRHGLEDLTMGLADLDITNPNVERGSEPPQLSPAQTHPPGISQVNLNQQEQEQYIEAGRERGRGVVDTTQGLSGVDFTDRQHDHREYASDSSGSQMIDNDSDDDCGLTVVDHMPIPDDEQ